MVHGGKGRGGWRKKSRRIITRQFQSFYEIPANCGAPAAGSLSLDHIAASGTSVAEQAATWLRYYYPHAAPYHEPRPLPVAAMHPTAATTLDALTEVGLYPNPATTEVILRYHSPAGQIIEIQLFSLLTSQQVLLKRLPATISQTNIPTEYALDVRQLPAGQYSYRFVVNGKAQASHHFAIQK